MRSATGNGMLHSFSLLSKLAEFMSCSPVCDSYVRPETLVRICDECNFGTYGGRCIICGSPGLLLHYAILRMHPNLLLYCLLGISDAYYCAECTRLEKDRDGCPKIVNLGASRTDLFYERRRLGTCFLCIFRTQSLISRCFVGFKKG